MQKWEYLYVTFVFTNEVVWKINGKIYQTPNGKAENAWVTLNKIGEKGWELVGFHPHVWNSQERMVFKRPLQQE